MIFPPFNDGLFSKMNGIITSPAWRKWLSSLQQKITTIIGTLTITGTGFIHVIGGVIQAAAKLVTNAEVDAAAGIVESKLSLNFPTHVATSIGGLPLTLVGQQITFNYDAVSLGLIGNDLYVINDGHTHDTQYLAIDGSNANVTIDINDEDLTTTGQLFVNHDTVGIVTENIIEAEGELQSTTQDTTMNFFMADMNNGTSYPSAGTQIKCGYVVDNVCRHNQSGGTYKHYGAYFNMGSIAEIPGAPLVVNHDLYGARIGRGTLCVSNALGGSWQDINAYGIYLYGWGGAGDDDSGLANLNKWAIYSDGGDVELTNGNLDTTGDITCNTLNYTTLNPAIVPAGANTQVQINNAGAFGADANFTYDFAGTVTVGPGLNVSTLNIATGSITDSTGTISFGDENLITTGQINIRDAAIYLYSSLDGWLNLVADIGVEVNAPILNIAALYSVGDIDSDTNITAVGTVTGSNLSGTNTGDETTTTIGALINGAADKATPIDADYVGLMDSAAANILKKLSWANIKATLKTYFDSLYSLLGLHEVYTGLPYTVQLTDTYVRFDSSGNLTLPDPAAFGNRSVLINTMTGVANNIMYGGAPILSYTGPALIIASSDGVATWTAHALTHRGAHYSGGLDPIDHTGINSIGTNTHAQIDTHIANTSNPHTTTDANLITSDVTTNNVSTTKHGFAPKVPNDETQGISGINGTWTIVGYSPIGAIIAWHKSFPNTPALSSNWVECNGQTLSDGDSPYDGQVIPNLNGAAAGADLSNGDNLGKTGEVFLKGDETSGATQFDSFQGHWHNIYDNDGNIVSITSSINGTYGCAEDSSRYDWPAKARDPITDGISGTPRTSSTTKPRNMTVVWIMRIK
jgi:hypothetical protein